VVAVLPALTPIALPRSSSATQAADTASAAVVQPRFTSVLPETHGIRVIPGKTVVIPDASDVRGTRLQDGRLVLIGSMTGNHPYSVWSNDDGRTWKKGPRGPDDETVLDFGNGEILSIYPTTNRRPDGKFSLNQRRSLDNWKTITEEEGIVDTPRAVSIVGDDGKTQPGGLMLHHGIAQLKNGDLMATMYGTYAEDQQPAEGYPVSMKMRKTRTIVVFSSDRGRTWGRAITVAADQMLARGENPDFTVKRFALAPAVTQEGFGEAHLVRAPDGDLLCLMRSGGRLSFPEAPVFPTPLYAARSCDEGVSWLPPVQILDRGTSPIAATLGNKLMVAAYSRPNGWLAFSSDDGRTWRGVFQISTSDGNVNVLAVGTTTILALYYAHGHVTGTFLTVDRTERYHPSPSPCVDLHMFLHR
jgi:hypothetical protein